MSKEDREGANINKSLLALSNVIHQLSKAQKKFINFRDSKLTRILQPALGGNSNTLIICTISPTRDNYQETLNTLLFGVKAKKIKNVIKVNKEVINDSTRLTIALKEIEHLKEELRLSIEDKDDMKVIIELKKELAMKQEELDNLQDLLYENNEESPSNKIREARDTLNELKEIKTRLGDELTELKQQKRMNEQLMKNWANENNKIKELEALVHSQSIYLKGLNEELCNLKGINPKKEVLPVNYADKIKENKELVIDINKLHVELEQHKKLITILKLKNEKCESELRVETNRRLEFERELKQLNKQTSVTSKKLYEKTRKLSLVEKERDLLIADIASYKAVILKELKNSSNEMLNEIQQLRTEIETLKQDNYSLKSEFRFIRKRGLLNGVINECLKRKKLE